MQITFPIPVSYQGMTYREATIRKMTAGGLADTSKMIETGDTYKALAVFAAAGLESIEDESDRPTIRNLALYMPYKSLEYVIIMILSLSEKDDGVEGYYECPRCHAPAVAEYSPDENIDTRDHILSFPVTTTEDTTFEYTLKTPVEIKGQDEVVDVVDSFEFTYPTALNCSSALSRVGLKDKVRMQLAVLAEAVTKVNGRVVEKNWKSSYGPAVFDKLEKTDIAAITDLSMAFGIDPAVQKRCLKCQKEFKVTVDTSNFFASALR